MTPHPERTAITFLLDALEAQRVTLEGTFNYWVAKVTLCSTAA